MSIGISSMTVHCPRCEYTASQIDTSRERCEDVCMDAMERHLAEAHPDFGLPKETTP